MDYTTLLSRLKANPLMSAEEFGAAMVASYRDFVESPAYGFGDHDHLRSAWAEPYRRSCSVPPTLWQPHLSRPQWPTWQRGTRPWQPSQRLGH